MARITLDADDLDQLTEAERDIVVLQLVLKNFHENID
jgi:hypothetical protein